MRKRRVVCSRSQKATKYSIPLADTSKYGECPLDIGLVMDDWFVLVEASDGDDWDSITGVITYGYETYGIQPRDLDDLVGG